MCGNSIVCEVDNIQTTCEEDKGKIALEIKIKKTLL
jgi:hypothetical protein